MVILFCISAPSRERRIGKHGEKVERYAFSLELLYVLCRMHLISIFSSPRKYRVVESDSTYRELANRPLDWSEKKARAGFTNSEMNTNMMPLGDRKRRAGAEEGAAIGDTHFFPGFQAAPRSREETLRKIEGRLHLLFFSVETLVESAPLSEEQQETATKRLVLLKAIAGSIEEREREVFEARHREVSEKILKCLSEENQKKVNKIQWRFDNNSIRAKLLRPCFALNGRK